MHKYEVAWRTSGGDDSRSGCCPSKSRLWEDDSWPSFRYPALRDRFRMAAQVAADVHSTLPCLGASGAIAAVMGAFLVTYPTDRVKSLLIIGWFVRITLIPAALLIGFWFLMQLLNAGAVVSSEQGGVAYAAHIGGMVFGAIFARLFEGPRRLFEQLLSTRYV